MRWGCLLALACEAPAAQLAAERAIEHLAITRDELGLDVVVSVQIYAAQKDDARAAEVAGELRAGLSASELERYGVLLDVEKTVFAASRIGEAGGPPRPEDELGDDRSSRCLEEVLACSLAPDCVEYLELPDRGGYVLTHQAVSLLFARWIGCELPIDVDARRRAIGARLVEEMRSDPDATELAFERIAVLGHLGFPIDPAEWDRVLGAQHENGCFSVAPGGECHPHPTGVAVWALAHAPW